MYLNEVLISIITPVYNRESLIRISIESLLSQTYTNWEMLIVDDGSTDNTVNVIREYAQKDQRIKLFKRNRLPKGGNTCRNIGLENAQGEYVIFLDSDDKLMPFCLEKRMGVVSQNPNFDFWVFNGIRTYIDGSENDPNNFIISAYDGGEDALPQFVRHDFLWQTTGPIYRKTSLQKEQLSFEEEIKVHQDVLFHIMVLCRGLQFYISLNQEPDYYWIVHNTGHVGTNVNIQLLNSNLLYIDKIIEELNNAGNDIDKYKLDLLYFLLRDLCRFGVYLNDKNNIGLIINKIREYNILSENKIKSIKNMTAILSILPNNILRRKLMTLYCILKFKKPIPNKYFLIKQLKDLNV